MATHKVPQDVETDDKLIGFLSMKQFIFVIAGLGFGYLTFFFTTKIHFLAGIIWVPFTVIFLVLGLYQRKDQPVEIYLASAIRFYLKPHKRKWNQEGYEERVVITAPPKVERKYTKDFTGEEAVSRLDNLSRLMDSRGWTTKLPGEWQNPQLANTASSERLVQSSALAGNNGIDVQQYLQPADMMDENTNPVAQDFQSKIDQVDSSAKQHALQIIQQAQGSASDPTVDPGDDSEPIENSAVKYQKYPEMKQKTIEPSQPEPTKTTPVTPATPAVEPPQITLSKSPVPPNNPQPVETDDGSVEISLH